MTSPRQLEANRANAKASTGPSTSAGRTRAARNALRHGLAILVLGDTAWSLGVEALAGRIAGLETDRELLEKAGAIAEAQIDLARMRAHRRRVIEQTWATLESGWTDTTERRDAPPARRVKSMKGEVSHERLDGLSPRVEGGPLSEAEKRVAILDSMAEELAAMDRYERRALSRREFAIRALDALKLVRPGRIEAGSS